MKSINKITVLIGLFSLIISVKAQRGSDEPKAPPDSMKGKSFYHLADSALKRLDIKQMDTPYLVDRIPFNRFVQFNPRIIS